MQAALHPPPVIDSRNGDAHRVPRERGGKASGEQRPLLLRGDDVRMCAAGWLLFFTVALLGCSSGSGDNGPLPVPSPPNVPSQQPPDLDVSGPWNGQASDSIGAGAFTLSLHQDGGVVTGPGSITEDKLRNLLFAGTLSASTLYFNFNYGANCVRLVSGTMTAGANTMSGTFSGSNSCGGTIANGQFTLTSGRPDINGTWSGTAPSVLGPGTWTWQVNQDGNRISASVSVATNIFHETDALSGALSYVPGGFLLTGTFPLSGCSGVTASVGPGPEGPPATATELGGVLTLSNASCTGGLAGDFVLSKQ